MSLGYKQRQLNAKPDLRDWLQQVNESDELLTLNGVDPELEIGAIAEINAQKRGPAIIFDEIKGYKKGFRVLISATISPERLSLTLGMKPFSLRNLLTSLEGKHSEWLSKERSFSPKVVSDGPVLENSANQEEIDLLKFPAPLWNELDGGRYLGTGDIVILRDPETNLVNLGTYRIMVHDKQTLGIYISPSHHGALIMRKYHAQGKPCPVAVSFGHHPIMLVAGSSALPFGISEYNYAGAVLGRSIDVINGAVTGLPIPASSELAIEGFIPPNKTMPEGPFGEYTGYYTSGRQNQTIIEVSAVYHRDDPIILGAMNNKPPHDYTLLSSVMKSMMVKDQMIAAGIPEVRGVWFHEAAAVNFLIAVSIHQVYKGHSTQAGLIAAQTQVAATGNGRYVVVVDDDIDPMNLEELVWAIGTRSNPETGIDIIRRTFNNKLDPIAPRDSKEWSASRAVIDACRPFSQIKDFPVVVSARPEIKKLVAEKFRQLNFSEKDRTLDRLDVK